MGAGGLGCGGMHAYDGWGSAQAWPSFVVRASLLQSTLPSARLFLLRIAPVPCEVPQFQDRYVPMPVAQPVMAQPVMAQPVSGSAQAVIAQYDQPLARAALAQASQVPAERECGSTFGWTENSELRTGPAQLAVLSLLASIWH